MARGAWFVLCVWPPNTPYAQPRPLATKMKRSDPVIFIASSSGAMLIGHLAICSTVSAQVVLSVLAHELCPEH